MAAAAQTGITVDLDILDHNIMVLEAAKHLIMDKQGLAYNSQEQAVQTQVAEQAAQTTVTQAVVKAALV